MLLKVKKVTTLKLMLWRTTLALDTASSEPPICVDAKGVINSSNPDWGILGFVVQHIWIASRLDRAEIVSKIYKHVVRELKLVYIVISTAVSALIFWICKMC